MKPLFFLMMIMIVLTISCSTDSKSEPATEIATDVTINPIEPAINTPPATLSYQIVYAYVNSGKGRFITQNSHENPTIAIIKYSKIADSLVYWTYSIDDSQWYFLDNK